MVSTIHIALVEIQSKVQILKVANLKLVRNSYNSVPHGSENKNHL